MNFADTLSFSPPLRDALLNRKRYVSLMAEWSWTKTTKHLDLIDQQLGWAYKQRDDDAMCLLEERRSQVVAARMRKLDNEQNIGNEK